MPVNAFQCIRSNPTFDYFMWSGEPLVELPDWARPWVRRIGTQAGSLSIDIENAAGTRSTWAIGDYILLHPRGDIFGQKAADFFANYDRLTG